MLPDPSFVDVVEGEDEVCIAGHCASEQADIPAFRRLLRLALRFHASFFDQPHVVYKVTPAEQGVADAQYVLVCNHARTARLQAEVLTLRVVTNEPLGLSLVAPLHFETESDFINRFAGLWPLWVRTAGDGFDEPGIARG